MAGRSASMNARLTVYSSLWAMNSLVPSSGSTKTKLTPTPIRGSGPVSSSETTGTPGNSLASPSRITDCAASSAAVTGLRSAFSRTANALAAMSRIARPAWETRPVSASTRAGSIGCTEAARDVVVCVGYKGQCITQGHLRHVKAVIDRLVKDAKVLMAEGRPPMSDSISPRTAA